MTATGRSSFASGRTTASSGDAVVHSRTLAAGGGRRWRSSQTSWQLHASVRAHSASSSHTEGRGGLRWLRDCGFLSKGGICSTLVVAHRGRFGHNNFLMESA
ncbi:NAC domain containing protein 38 [Striga asiatica]|uniref:NAC domain containing protein 38 n=1 Tax=Striga asiatica TaxID=4170 RepID=A0A5A7QYE9_STRAF|nr:NAC domain containing protein 38 [Striga asiatica]